jgi:hypothetical protein
METPKFVKVRKVSGINFDCQMDFAQWVKVYGKGGNPSNPEKMVSPAGCIGWKKSTIEGNPDP